ncbi:MAG: HRDC domain-containing protein [Rhodospirillaceae bacterium]
MSSEVNTFFIPDSNPDSARAEIGAFLRSVVVDRVDTSYAGGGWHVLVLFQDSRCREESEQIESMIKGALARWREREAANSALALDQILSDEVMNDIAHYAPTTERELATIASSHNFDVANYGSAIVLEVKKMLDALID